MIGFRILALVLALLCLAGGAMMVFPEQEPAVTVSGFLLNPELKEFVQSPAERDIVVRDHIKYLLLMGAVGAFGLAVLFLISAAKPLAMRPFVVTLIICLILGIAAALWYGPRMKIYTNWWLADTVGGVVLAILLITFFPRRSAQPPPPLEDQVGQE